MLILNIKISRDALHGEGRPSLSKLNGVGGQIWNLIGLIGGAMTAVSPHSSIFLAGHTGSVK
ncbi:hypothetical protein [Nitrobacter sp.]|uniref:hypothetical protein n=1 Tax=Nitrobacter sp. TaxID=29420 RepID=UPI00399D779E